MLLYDELGRENGEEKTLSVTNTSLCLVGIGKPACWHERTV
jgi:hypothetical protein